MLKLLILLSLLTLISCARAKKVAIKNFSYELGENAKLAVNSLKRVNRRIEFSLLGLSVGDSVAIKPEEIRCGAGEDEFSKISISPRKQPLLIFPKINYLEFTVKCTSRFDVTKESVPFIIFKKIYRLRENAAAEVLDTDIKIKFE